MDIETISAANNQFALNVFKHLYESHKGVNTFLSPLLLTTSLGITYMGATGETRGGIAKTLGWETTADEKCLVQLENYIKALRAESGDHVTMTSGIKILLDKKWSCLEEFKRSIERFEFTEILSYDSLQDCDQVVSDVHKWIADINKDNSNNDLKLDGVLQPQKMSLFSCVHFKGKWDRGFEAKNTQLLPFVVAPGTSEDVPMMCITGRYPYIKDNDLRYSAIELPYQGGHLGVVIILPDEYFGLGDLLRNMNLETVAELLKNLYMADSPVNLIVPKFKNGISDSTIFMKEWYDPSYSMKEWYLGPTMFMKEWVSRTYYVHERMVSRTHYVQERMVSRTHYVQERMVSRTHYVQERMVSRTHYIHERMVSPDSTMFMKEWYLGPTMFMKEWYLGPTMFMKEWYLGPNYVHERIVSRTHYVQERMVSRTHYVQERMVSRTHYVQERMVCAFVADSRSPNPSTDIAQIKESG
ncbi:hypothetical protein Btru_050889 [Bulinus truncatus]|nr:hypothetical protein Btru_050889 [Bulinus truncatus]